MDPVTMTIAVLTGAGFKAVREGSGNDVLTRAAGVLQARASSDKPVAEALDALAQDPDDGARLARLSATVKQQADSDIEFRQELEAFVNEARHDLLAGQLVTNVYALSDLDETRRSTYVEVSEDWPEPPPEAIPDSGFRIEPVSVSAPTTEDVALQVRAEQVPIERLQRVRDTAEKWGATTAAVFTALGFATFLQGRKQISSLTSDYEPLAGALLLGAFTLAILAVGFAALSAQGNPRGRHAFVTGPELREVEANEADKAGLLLTASRTSAALAVLAVLGAFTTLWFAPSDTEAGDQTVFVLLRSGETECGALKKQGGGRLEIKTGGVQKALDAADIRSISTVTDCP